MTTTLERAARAAAKAAYVDGEFEEMGRYGQSFYTDIARAVLMAVRVPCSDVAESGMIAGEFSGMADTAFTAMIDAILEGK